MLLDLQCCNTSSNATRGRPTRSHERYVHYTLAHSALVCVCVRESSCVCVCVCVRIFVWLSVYVHT